MYGRKWPVTRPITSAIQLRNKEGELVRSDDCDAEDAVGISDENREGKLVSLAQAEASELPDVTTIIEEARNNLETSRTR